MAPKYNVFISHAGEDKSTLAELIYEGLKKMGITAFLDRPELRVGGDAKEEMEKAMETALIGLFILSPEFAMKVWPMKELEHFIARALAAAKSRGGKVPVLIPVFYRLTVAESRYRDGNLFTKYAALATKLRFFDRVGRGEADMKQVLDSLALLSGYTGIENDEGATNEAGEEMEKRRQDLADRICEQVSSVMSNLCPTPCNVPENNMEVILDFDCSKNGNGRQSYESKVLEEILREDGDRNGRQIVSVKGGAGVGKSCILRGVGAREEVRRKFRDGVYYIALGMDATEETLIRGLLKMLRACGRRDIAEELKGENDLDFVLESVRDAMKGKKSLVLMDDVWEGKGLGAWTVEQVCKVQEKGSGSVLALTTRSTEVALKGKVVEILPREPLSEEAERILLKHARVSAKDIIEKVRKVLYELLRLCGGLPVCLAVMGRGLGELFIDVGSTGSEVWERYREMMKNGKQLVWGDVDDYKNLWTTLNASLTVLEERKGKFIGAKRRLSWREMHQSFCVMKKQAVVSVGVFARMWGLVSEEEALFVIKGFSGVGLANIEVGRMGTINGVRLHDLIHDFSVTCAESKGGASEWHRRLLNAYISEEDRKGSVRRWWDIESDGYIRENLCRHLGSSGAADELVELLLSARWAISRVERAELLSWTEDFSDFVIAIQDAEMNAEAKRELIAGLLLVRDALLESWTFLTENVDEFAFQVYGRLLGSGGWPVQKFLASARKHQKKPWLEPLEQCWERPGKGGRGREFAFKGHVWDIAMHNERHRAVAGVGNDVVYIDMEGMRVLRTFTGHTGSVKSVAINSDTGCLHSWSEDGEVRKWDTNTGEQMGPTVLSNPQSRRGDRPLCGAFCANCTLVVTGSLMGFVELWDAGNGERVVGPLGRFGREVLCVSVSRDGQKFAAGGANGNLMIWDVSTRAQVGSVLKGHKKCVNCAAWSADGRFIASGSDDGTICVWDVQRGTRHGDPINARQGHVESIHFSNDGLQFLSGGTNGTVRIWDFDTGEKVGLLLRGRSESVRCLSITSDNRFVLSGDAGKSMWLWDLAVAEDDDAEELLQHDSTTECLDLSADGRYFVSGSNDGVICVWDGWTGALVGRTLNRKGSSTFAEPVNCIAVSPSSTRFVASYSDDLQVWDIETLEVVGEPLMGLFDLVLCVTYTPNGHFIVSGHEDRNVRIWRTATHHLVGAASGGNEDDVIHRPPSTKKIDPGRAHCRGHTVEMDKRRSEFTFAHTSWVTCVRVSRDGGRIVCGLKDGALCVWDLASRTLLSMHRSAQRWSKIVRLDISASNQVRSLNEFDIETKWQLDEDGGLTKITAGHDVAQWEDRGEGSDPVATGVGTVVCQGRFVRAGKREVKLATLPASVHAGQWEYNASTGLLGVLLRDGNFGRLVFFRVVM